MRYSIDDFKNTQPLDFDVLTPQIPSRKVREVFLVWFPI